MCERERNEKEITVGEREWKRGKRKAVALTKSW
jgi:hypothetical protein